MLAVQNVAFTLSTALVTWSGLIGDEAAVSTGDSFSWLRLLRFCCWLARIRPVYGCFASGRKTYDT